MMLTVHVSQDQGWRKGFTIPTGEEESKLEARHRLFSSLTASQEALVSVTVTGVRRGVEEVPNSP